MKNKELFMPPKEERQRISKEELIQEIMDDTANFSDSEYYLAIRRINGGKMEPDKTRQAETIIENWWKNKHGDTLDFNFTKEKLPDKKEPETESKDIIEKQQKQSDDFFSKIDEANRILLEAHQLPIASASEMKDSTMTSDKKDWFHYWINRLSVEINTLPEEIGNFVKKAVRHQILKTGELNDIAKYINNRAAAMKFSLEKRVVMAELKQRLKNIDEGKDYSKEETEGRKIIKYDSKTDALFIDQGDKRYKITSEDIAADGEWGNLYLPDDSVPRLLWRKIRKESDISEARRKIEKIFNQELSSFEHVSLPTTNISVMDFEKLIKSNPTSANGVIAERMAKTLLTRNQRIESHQLFRVESSNALEDAELKYDFKVIFTERARGIKIEGDAMPRSEYITIKKTLGFQFTVSHSSQSLSKKSEQISAAKKVLEEHRERYEDSIKRKVDDIVLLSIPFKTYGECFKRWVSEGRPPGGPEQFLRVDQKIKIIEAATRGVLSDEEREKLGIK